MIAYACMLPHAPILLPDVGSPEDRERAKNTIRAMEKIGRELEKVKFDKIIISSPHEDWGFDVPLKFAAANFNGKTKKILTGFETPQEHFEKGKKIAQKLDSGKNHVLIASGDLSHRLKEDGPYGFHEQGPKFDQELIKVILNVRTNAKYNFSDLFGLEDKYPEAGDCGLRSFCFVLGILEGARAEVKPEILSYEGPFGVGYMVAKLV